jgi:hypothetical protein
LDEQAIDVGALEKVTKLASSEQFGNALPVEHPIIEHARPDRRHPDRSSRASV